MPFLRDPSAEEDALECLCKLLETAGCALVGLGFCYGRHQYPASHLAAKLDTDQPVTIHQQNKTGKAAVDLYMAQLDKIKERPGLSSRVKFMVQDILDLRSRRRWRKF